MGEPEDVEADVAEVVVVVVEVSGPLGEWVDAEMIPDPGDTKPGDWDKPAHTPDAEVDIVEALFDPDGPDEDGTSADGSPSWSR